MHIILFIYLSIYTPKEALQPLNQQQMYQTEISDSPGHSSGSPRSAGLSDGYVEVEIELRQRHTHILRIIGVYKKNPNAYLARVLFIIIWEPRIATFFIIII
jgi:hypothetical protein